MTESTKNPRRNYRLLRINLRTFLIMITILSAWVGWYVYRAEQQRAAVQWVQENGGSVEFEFEVDETRNSKTNTQSSVIKWLHKMFGVNYFECVVGVDLRDGAQVNELEPLTGLKNLERIELWSDHVSDLSPLASLSSLESLTLLCTDKVSDLSPLAGLTNLKHLTIEDSQVSDLSPLAGLAKLEGLFLGCSQVSDLSPLAGLTNLEELGLFFRNAQEVSDLSPLAGLTNLQKLWLENSEVSSEEIANLQKALPNCQITH